MIIICRHKEAKKVVCVCARGKTYIYTHSPIVVSPGLGFSVGWPFHMLYSCVRVLMGWRRPSGSVKEDFFFFPFSSIKRGCVIPPSYEEYIMKWDNYSLLWSRRSCYWFLIESLSFFLSLCVYLIGSYFALPTTTTNHLLEDNTRKWKWILFFCFFFFYLSKRASRKDEGGCVCFILDSFSTVSAVYIHIHMHRRKKIKTNLQRIPRQSPYLQTASSEMKWKKNVKLLFACLKSIFLHGSCHRL